MHVVSCCVTSFKLLIAFHLFLNDKTGLNTLFFTILCKYSVFSTNLLVFHYIFAFYIEYILIGFMCTHVGLFLPTYQPT